MADLDDLWADFGVLLDDFAGFLLVAGLLEEDSRR